ncbi:MAG: gas vesicle protein [Bacteroidetes bacterium]|nr:gas vesicle protein [Bacteroidota bacterium]
MLEILLRRWKFLGRIIILKGLISNVLARGPLIILAACHRGRKSLDELDIKTKNVTILEILDRVLDKGVVISGDIVISVADVDLIYLGLRALLSSVETMEKLKGMY